jgi:transposase
MEVIMARRVTGHDMLPIAQKGLKAAKTADEIRRCQAVIFPVEFGLSLEQTASLLGRSLSWTNQARSHFSKHTGLTQGKGAGGRRRSSLSIEEEKEFLDPFIKQAKDGGILVVTGIHAALEARLGHKVSLASVYNLLHRHDWRKLVPNKRHIKADPVAQEEWKKNSQKPSRF